MDRYQETLTAIEGLIKDGAISTNGRLPTERALSDRLGVGRRTLRRALETLENQGRIYRRQGRGTFLLGDGRRLRDRQSASMTALDISALSQIANPVEMIELRIALEPIMCRLAALRSSQRDVEDLRDLARQTEQAKSFQAYEAADGAFHHKIAQLSGNGLFAKLQAALGEALRDTALARFGESGHCFKRQAEHVGFHHAIVEAIARRDANRAESLMHEHLSDVHRSLFNDILPPGSMARRVEKSD